MPFLFVSIIPFPECFISPFWHFLRKFNAKIFVDFNKYFQGFFIIFKPFLRCIDLFWGQMNFASFFELFSFKILLPIFASLNNSFTTLFPSFFLCWPVVKMTPIWPKKCGPNKQLEMNGGIRRFLSFLPNFYHKIMIFLPFYLFEFKFSPGLQGAVIAFITRVVILLDNIFTFFYWI